MFVQFAGLEHECEDTMPQSSHKWMLQQIHSKVKPYNAQRNSKRKTTSSISGSTELSCMINVKVHGSTVRKRLNIHDLFGRVAGESLFFEKEHGSRA